MGYNRWSDDDYDRKERDRKKLGKSALTYTDDEMRRVRPEDRKCHQKLDPRSAIRESRDSATHPESLAIQVIFDHTGSMGTIPRVVQKKLKNLMGLLLNKGRIEHPQILFGAVGDATSDQAPLQVGQFESGVEMDEDLGRMLLEGSGGPFGEESYELAIYFAAKRTRTDCWEKRNKKGYLFLMGDELPYPKVKAREVQEIFDEKIDKNIPVEEIVKEAQKRYHVFFLIPTYASGGTNAGTLRKWVNLLGQEFVIQIKNPELTSETIALLVGINEGKITKEEGLGALKELGLDAAAMEDISKALAAVKETKNPAKEPPESDKKKTAEGSKEKKKGKKDWKIL